jgi:biopolymer transport protein TolQ
LVTFSSLQTHTITSANTTVLAGLATALATTVLGLLIAIPALVAHNYLKNAIHELNKDMENFSQLLLTTVELQYRKADIVSV